MPNPTRQDERLVLFNSDSFADFVDANEPPPPHEASLSTFSEPGLPTNWKLPVYQNDALRLVINRIRPLSQDGITAYGRVVGDPNSRVTLTFKNETLTGDIEFPLRAQKILIRPNDQQGEGAHVIRTMRLVPPTQPDASPPAVTDDSSAGEPADDIQGNEDEVDGDFQVIDVLVAYSPRARRELGRDNLVSLIQQGVYDANQAFSESGASARVRLVGVMETKQDESGNLNQDLYRLQGKADGRWDEVHAERARLRADQVTLVGSYQNASWPSGSGFFNAHRDSAFTVIKASAIPYYTFVHELGHNLGLDHSDGYQNSNGRFSTIMAISGLKRIRRFSNPIVTYGGPRTGDHHHNETSIINLNAPRLAGFY